VLILRGLLFREQYEHDFIDGIFNLVDDCLRDGGFHNQLPNVCLNFPLNLLPPWQMIVILSLTSAVRRNEDNKMDNVGTHIVEILQE
jgi:hypothetical protein